MDKYYVDTRRNEVVKNLDTSFLAPECYYEYTKGINDDMVTEVYQDGKGIRLNFSWHINDKDNLGKRRIAYFKENNFEMCNLVEYIVPKKWFIDSIKGLLSVTKFLKKIL